MATDNKTQDGLRIGRLLRAALEKGITTREGASHRILLEYQGLRPCPVGPSTDARKMIVPWMQEATGYNSQKIYNALRTGSWQ